MGRGEEGTHLHERLEVDRSNGLELVEDPHDELVAGQLAARKHLQRGERLGDRRLIVLHLVAQIFDVAVLRRA